MTCLSKRGNPVVLMDSMDQSIVNHAIVFTQVGICGRTGSGKSSFSLAFFRMVDMFEGMAGCECVIVCVCVCLLHVCACD